MASADKGLDRFDIRILNLLQQDNLATAESLSGSVPLSPSAITRRVRRLREEGFIAADVAVLGPAIVERRLRALVLIQLHDHAEEGAVARLRRNLRGVPEIQTCLEIAGTFDLAALVVARDMAGFNALADRWFGSEPAIRRYETSFVKRAIKDGRAIPLGPEDATR